MGKSKYTYILISIAVLVILTASLTVCLSNLKEKYTTDPIATGIERRLWGPLMPLELKEGQRNLTINSTPWCCPPMAGGIGAVQCNLRTMPNIEVPYEENKI